MDRLISAGEASMRFPDILRDVAAGDSYTVVEDGHQVARITPYAREDRQAAVDQLLEHIRTMPIRHSGPWIRADLYE